MGFTDIRLDLLNRLPKSWRPYALLMRLDRPIGWWLLLLPGWWALALASGGIKGLNLYGLYLFVLFFVGAVLMRGAGCIINDLWDRDLDAQVERTRLRPLASGAVTVPQAAVFLSVLLIISLLILIQLPAFTIALGFVSMLFVISYPYMKRITWWPQAFLGLTFNFGVLMGWSAIEGSLGAAPIIMYVAAFFWTLGYDTIYAHQDKEDDVMVGIKSTALLFGQRSKLFVGMFYGAAWLLLFSAAVWAQASILSIGLLILPGIHMALQLLLWTVDSPASSLHWFKSNRICGLLFLLAFLCA
jgi:4-hydroxybenzoate polyprenyltransferase